MNSLIATLLVTIAFTSSGWYLTYLIPSAGKIERFGLSFLLGAGLSTLFWFVFYRLGVPLNLVSFGLAVLFTAMIGYVIAKILHLSPDFSSLGALKKSEKYLVVSIIFLLLSAFIIGSYNPLTAWDSIALYDFRGHVIAQSHSLSDFTGLSYYISYPMMISLVHSLVYMLHGESAQGIHALIFTSFIAVIYGRMSSWLKPKYALLACLLIILQNEIFSHATFAYTNLPYTAYLVAGFLYAISTGSYSLVLAGLMFGLSTWVRFAEVFWIAGMMLMLYEGIRSKRILSSFVGWIIILSLRYSWTSYTGPILQKIGEPTQSITAHVGLGMFPQIFHNMPLIINYILEYLVNPYIIIWLLVIPSIAISLSKKNTRLLSLIGGLLLSTGLVVAGVMIFSTYFDTWNQIGDSAKRMILFIIPYTIIMSVYSLAQISENTKHDK